MRQKCTVLAGLVAVFVILAHPGTAQDFMIDESLRADRTAVLELQRQLNDLGMDAGRPDGAFGPRTRAAIEAFAARFPSDVPVGLGAAMQERIAQVHQGRFGNPFEQELARLSLTSPLPNFMGATNVRETVPGCTTCNAISLILVTGDLTGDGRDEIVVSTHLADPRFNVIDRPSPLVIFSPGQTGPKLNTTLIEPEMPSRVHEREAVIADFNSDGQLDLFIAAAGWDAPPFPGEQNVLLLSDAGRLIDVSDSHLPRLDDMAHGVAAGDINGNGHVDLLIITNQGTAGHIPYVLLNDGQGRFERTPIAQFLDPALVDFRPADRRHRAEFSTARLIDMNGNGALDLLLLARGEDAARAGRFPGTRQSLLLFNDGTGRFPTETMIELPTDRWGLATFTNDAAAVDLDGDGHLDLILTQSTRGPGNGEWFGHYLQVLMFEDGTYVERTAERLWPQGYPDMPNLSFADKTRLVDLTGNGHPDIVTATLSPSWRDRPDEAAITIGLNDGTGHFRPVAPTWLTGGHRSYSARQIVPGVFSAEGLPGLAAYDLNGVYGSGPDQTFGVRLNIYTPGR